MICPYRKKTTKHTVSTTNDGYFIEDTYMDCYEQACPFYKSFYGEEHCIRVENECSGTKE